MSDEIDSQIEDRKPRRNSGGGSNSNTEDGRVTRFIDWVQPIVSTLAVAAIVYLANQFGGVKDAINDMRTEMALSRQTSTVMADELRDHEVRIRDNTAHIQIVEGKILRGQYDEFGLLPDKADKTQQARRGH